MIYDGIEITSEEDKEMVRELIAIEERAKRNEEVLDNGGSRV
jgi:hypothetical protein